MSPLSQGAVDGQELPIPHVVIGLCWGETTGQEGYRVNVLVLLRPLGEDDPDANIRGVNLNYETDERAEEGWAPGAEVNRLLRAENASSWTPEVKKGTEGRRQGGEWGLCLLLGDGEVV